MRRTLVFACCALFAAACSSSTGTGSGDEDADVSGAGDVSDTPSDPGTLDTAADVPTADTDEPSDLLETGELCDEDEQCAGGTCVRPNPGSTDGVCTDPCVDDAGCPENWDCVLVGGTGTDAERICIPGATCVDNDGDGYGFGQLCDGVDCDDANGEVYPAADEVCDGLDNDCDGIIDDNPVLVGDSCESGFSGDCAEGRYSCDGGNLNCVPLVPPEEEVCDNVDNDCDGALDEDADGEPLAISCYDGPDGTEGVGICAGGTRICDAGVYGDCTGQTFPMEELCDGVDGDCDGSIDEGEPEAGDDCMADLGEGCTEGITACMEGDLVCVVDAVPMMELCDGRDNDCDGITDENADSTGPLTRACYTGPPGTENIGLCGDGVRYCEDADYGECRDQIWPVDELCDGLDNDCDGTADEDNPESGAACEDPLVMGCNTGLTTCEDGTLVCEITAMPLPELCDGFDNDCDGPVDEDDIGNPIAEPCYDGPAGTEGVGACQGGTTTCAMGAFGACDGQVLPMAEVCDGVDNDCDGEVDEVDAAGLTCEPGDMESMGCGDCGTQTRSCTSACEWSDWSGCSSEGVCTPGMLDSGPCGDCGTRTRECASTCEWGAWDVCMGEGICTPTATDSRDCGDCGTQTRTCSDMCGWGAFGACEGEGICTPGEIQYDDCGNCGTRQRTCTSACGWGAWSPCSGEGVCAPGASDSLACGNCGTQTRTCTSSCTWGAYGGCSGEGICSPGQLDYDSCGNCGQRSRSCTSSCSWGAWGTCGGQGPCSPGQSETADCGNCGSSSRTCNSSCQWNPYGACTGQGVCAPGQQTSAGCDGICQVTTCSSSCEWPTACTGCSSSCSSQYTPCGYSCDAGYHIVAAGQSISCGSGGFGANVTCQRDCGTQFTLCGYSCPTGYYVSSVGQSISCSRSGGFGDNTTCRIVDGSQFTACGFSCPTGYYVASTGQSIGCSRSGGFGNNVTCRRN